MPPAGCDDWAPLPRNAFFLPDPDIPPPPTPTPEFEVWLAELWRRRAAYVCPSCGENVGCRDRLKVAAALEFVLAQQLRAVLLIGFDGGVVPGRRAHFDNVAPSKTDDGDTARRFTCWPYLAEQAKAQGVRVINCSPQTVLECFEVADLDEVLPRG